MPTTGLMNLASASSSPVMGVLSEASSLRASGALSSIVLSLVAASSVPSSALSSSASANTLPVLCYHC